MTGATGAAAIRGFAEAALDHAGVRGIVPTPLGEVARAAGVAEIVDIGSLPEAVRRAAPPVMSRILGAYLFGAETAFVDGRIGAGRSNFVRAHEIAHRILPWHSRAFLLDDGRRLFRDAEDALEREANLLASLLIFQPGAFEARAEGPQTLRSAQALARAHGASAHATMRQLVQRHADPLALMVTGRDPRRDGSLQVITATESPTFRRRFGGLADLLRLHDPRGLTLPDVRLRAIGNHAAGPTGRRDLTRVIDNARLTGFIQRDEVGLRDRRGALRGFRVEALRQWSVLVLLTPLPEPARRPLVLRAA